MFSKIHCSLYRSKIAVVTLINLQEVQKISGNYFVQKSAKRSTVSSFNSQRSQRADVQCTAAAGQFSGFASQPAVSRERTFTVQQLWVSFPGLLASQQSAMSGRLQYSSCGSASRDC